MSHYGHGPLLFFYQEFLCLDIDFVRCAKAGQVVRDVLTSVIPRLQNAWNDVLDPGSSDWEPVYKQFRELLTSFCRR